MGSNIFLITGLVAVLGLAINFMRLWAFLSGGAGNRAKVARIANSDAHLSFDERITERLRELEKEGGAQPAAAPPPGFGRRGL